MRTIDLLTDQTEPRLMVFLCDQVTVDDEGNLLSVRVYPKAKYKIIEQHRLKKDTQGNPDDSMIYSVAPGLHTDGKGL